MADFRKLFLVLAVIAITAVSASAQTSFSCAVSPAGPATLRGGGLTEEVGDALYTCTGGPVGVVNGSFTAQLPGSAVTNRIVADNSGSGFLLAGVALSVEIRATPASLPTFYQVVQGLLQPSIPDTPATRNVVVFPNVNIPTGTTWDVKVRISGVRVSAPVVTSTQVATSVFEIISVSPSSAVPLTNPTQQVGQVYPALAFNVVGCNGGSAPTLTYQQCTSLNEDGSGNPTNALSFAVRFSELQPGAFKIITPILTNPNAEFSGRTFGPDQTAGAVTVSDVPGTKDTATRLILTLTNVPAGVTVRVTDREIGGGVSTATAMALNVPDANASGAGGTPAAGSTDIATCGGSSRISNTAVASVLQPDYLVDANSSGSTAYAVWEIVGSSSLNESLVFGVQLSYTANPGAGSPALTGTDLAIPGGNFAPQSTINYADKTSQIPRFQPQPITDNQIAIVPCVTNLLFPYVTSTSGYDTGIALVNTSLDNGTGSTDAPAPFDTSSQTGACTVYFFGNNTISPQTTPTVNPGSLVKFTMTNPPSTFTQATAGFEGYIIAQCAFQYAHGFAFIVDTRVPGFGSEGYLALVIPDLGGVRPPVNFVANGGAGEQLVH